MVAFGVTTELIALPFSLAESARISESAALANERVKTNEVLILQLKTDLAKAERRAQPRSIWPDERQRLVECLKQFQGPKENITVFAGLLDVEATQFAIAIENVLTNAGGSVRRPSVEQNGRIAGDAIMTPGSIGLKILVEDPSNAPPWAGWVQRCFMTNDFPMVGEIDTNFDASNVQIIVGQKP
jgi:hypothetical protein